MTIDFHDHCSLIYVHKHLRPRLHLLSFPHFTIFKNGLAQLEEDLRALHFCELDKRWGYIAMYEELTLVALYAPSIDAYVVVDFELFPTEPLLQEEMSLFALEYTKGELECLTVKQIEFKRTTNRFHHLNLLSSPDNRPSEVNSDCQLEFTKENNGIGNEKPLIFTDLAHLYVSEQYYMQNGLDRLFSRYGSNIFHSTRAILEKHSSVDSYVNTPPAKAPRQKPSAREIEHGLFPAGLDLPADRSMTPAPDPTPRIS